MFLRAETYWRALRHFAFDHFGLTALTEQTHVSSARKKGVKKSGFTTDSMRTCYKDE